MNTIKKVLRAIAAAALLLSLWPSQAPATVYYPPIKCTNSELNPLCAGAQAFFDFEEGFASGKSPRFSSFSPFQIYEGSGYDISTTTGKIGSYAASFPGGTTANIQPGFRTETGLLSSGQWTVAFWFNATDAASVGTDNQVFFSKEGYYTIPASRGSTIFLKDNGTTWSLAAYVVTQENNTVVTHTNSATASNGAWHLGVVTLSKHFSGQDQICSSFDGAAYQCTTVGYYPRPGGKFLDIGFESSNPSPYKAFHGAMDGIFFSSRVWTAEDVTFYYNGGAGIAPPF